MNKKTIIFTILIFTILITSCTSGPSNKKVQPVNYHTGTKGLEMKFTTSAPPDKIYKSTPLDVIIEYSNKGAYEIQGGKLYLSGFDPKYISFSPSSVENLVAEGKSVFNPNGEIKQITTFSDNSIGAGIPTSVDKIKQTIKATACYNYRTEASFDVCINPKTMNSVTEDICQNGPVSASGGQGAPIAITNIEEEIYQNKLQFKIYFQNSGGGTVLKSSAINNCHTSLNRNDANKVEVIEVSFSDKTMRCDPQNPVNIDDSGKGFIFCYYQGDLGQSAYKTTLKIVLDYGYRSSIQKEIEIQKSPI